MINRVILLHKKVLTIGVLALASMTSACQWSDTKKFEAPPIELSATGLQKVVNHTVDFTIIPNLNDWQSSANTMLNSSEKYCQNPTLQGLKGLQGDYQALATAWNRSVMYDFGPLRDNLFFPKVHFVESMRQRGKDYSKSIKSNFKKRLNDDRVLDESYFKKLKFTLVGMTAIEILLFDGSDSELLAAYQNPRQCQLLTGIVKLNAANADYVVNGWQQGSDAKPSYRQQFFLNKLPDGEKSLTKLIFAMQDYLRYIKQRKLEGKLDAKLSAMTFTNFSTGLKAVEDTLTAKQSGYGLFDYLNKAGKGAVVQRFQTLLQKTNAAIEQQDIETMKQLYSAMIKMLEKDIPQALGVNLGMNFVDGD